MSNLIDNDLEFYEAQVEEMKRLLKSDPHPHAFERVRAAKKVYQALQEYKATLGAGK